MKFFSLVRALATLCILGRDGGIFTVQAIDLDPTNPSQVRDAAKKVATELVAMYAKTNSDGDVITINSGIPGLLTYPPYYWWEAGAMFGQLIDYWYYTNDSTYNNLVKDGILAQIGDQGNLMPSNQSKDEGNDDQLFWAFTVMSAAELNFPNPSADQPGWLELAQSVINQLNSRWAPENCNGGIRWQIYQWITGYNYKNTAANGGMFQLAARLAKYTGNHTYAEWAERSFDWMDQSVLFTDDWKVNDGMDVLKDCKVADQTQWTYNYGIMIGGAAYMYNYTNGSSIWETRLSGFLNHIGTFFPQENGGVMTEICEKSQKCNVDQWSFKAYLARWLAVSAQLAPFTNAQIAPLLQQSAKAAARQCDGGPDKNICGSQWYMANDGNQGVGQQMSALSVISANLISEAPPPYSADTGGTSKGNPAAGTGTGDNALPVAENADTPGDRAGAAILTILILVFMMGGGWWLFN